jgi:sugar O-acyltransferase (sialic acid O-acetyltransferase NeuD family)
VPALPNVYVLGCGGHAKVVVQTLRALGYGIAGIFDDDAIKCGQHLLGIPVAGPIHCMTEHVGAPAVIAIGDNAVRQSIAQMYQADWLTIVHPRAYVDSTAQMGPGTVVFAGAVVQASTRIGNHVIVNTSASVDHDCVVEDHVHIAPGVRLAGAVSIGAQTFVGMGALILPERRVGANVVVGAGAVVTQDLPNGVTAVGVPARVIRRTTSEV